MSIKYINNTGEVFEGEEDLQILRHSSAHLLAAAIKRIYKEAKLAIGPAIDNGFYYDIDLDYKLNDSDLEKIEEEMKKIIKENIKTEAFTLDRKEALELMRNMGEDYKIELINDLDENEKLSFFKQGDFVDLCVGPHLLYLKTIKAFKLFNVTGAYWRGNEKNKMLQRIYGTAFFSKDDLEVHLDFLEEAKRRDHRKLGKELDLFMLSEEGPGFAFFLPKGKLLRNILEDFWRKEHIEAGYEEISTPMILSEELWHRSGHYDHYKENMYFTKIDESDYSIKPMNCPGGMLVFKRKLHSYKELPIRNSELGIVHRHELSGALHGLMRVRCFTQDDAHIYMTKDQITEEVVGVINLIDSIYSVFGFSYKIELSTRPEKAMGDVETWDAATEALKKAIEGAGREYTINEGDGAFYGPKLDFKLTDSLGRQWQCGTIQLDFQMPEKFDLNYIGADGEKHRPIMLHRTILGSIERFIGVLIEHYAGEFPLWLSPEQITILPISENQNGYAKSISDKLKEAGFRVGIDDTNEKIGYKIREAWAKKLPYMIILGKMEEEKNTISIRSRDTKIEETMSLDDFIQRLNNELPNVK